MAVFYIILTFRNASWWYFTLCMFYLALGLMRMRVLLAEQMGRSQTAVMRGIGISLALFSIVICGTTYLTIHEHQNPNKGMIEMIAIAAFTFVTAVMSIISTVKAHRKKSVSQITLRNISLAAAIGSMLSLERGMLGTFGDPTELFSIRMEAISGLAAFLLLIILGIGLILNARSLEK